jgi:hypothetical protein
MASPYDLNVGMTSEVWGPELSSFIGVFGSSFKSWTGNISAISVSTDLLSNHTTRILPGLRLMFTAHKIIVAVTKASQ